MFHDDDDDETDPERRPPLRSGAGEPSEQGPPPPSFPQGSQPSLTIPSPIDERSPHLDTTELCWLGGSPIEVESHHDAVAMVVLKTLRIRGTPDEAASIGRALLRAAGRARQH